MKCPRCQQENQPAAKFCDECSTPLQRPLGSTQPAPSYADLQRSLTESLEHQTATSEILRVISSSPSDVAPVFATIARNAMRLLGGATGGVFLVTGDRVHFGASATRERETRSTGTGSKNPFVPA